MTDSITTTARPEFLDAVSTAYSDRGKSVVVLTGDVHDLFWCNKISGGKFLELEQSIFQEWKDKFHVLRMDIATGISLYDDGELADIQRMIDIADGALPKTSADKFGKLTEAMKGILHQPLTALVTLRELFDCVTVARRGAPGKKMLTVIQLAGSLFPAGDFDRLNEADRQRLVTFLNMIQSPGFKNSEHLVVLVADTRSEINSRIIGLPSVECIEIQLPRKVERKRFVENFVGSVAQGKTIEFEKGLDDFVDATAGLPLTAVLEILEPARRTGAQIKRKLVNEAINRALQAELGDVIKIPFVEHGVADVLGYAEAQKRLKGTFVRCEDPKTAVSGALVSGPNGTGKTFMVQAHAKESGRVVIELTGLRSQWFGQTDILFEKLNLRLRNYGKVLICIDEAHTAFGSVHSSNTHETEKRLAGNIIKMMGDPTMLGQVLWVLMTSRPDQLDPDVKSRCPIQIPIFDMEGDDRKNFITQLCKKKGVKAIGEDEWEKVLKLTDGYSNRDFSFLMAEALSTANKSVAEALEEWQASRSIVRQRLMQKMIAAQHCSYPKLLPADLKDQVGTEEFERSLELLKTALGL